MSVKLFFRNLHYGNFNLSTEFLKLILFIYHLVSFAALGMSVAYANAQLRLDLVPYKV